MNLSAFLLKTYRTRFPPLHPETLNLLSCDPPDEGELVLISRKHALLFNHDQVMLILEIEQAMRDTSDLLSEASGKCKFASSVVIASKKSLPHALSSLVKSYTMRPSRFRCASCRKCSSSLPIFKALKPFDGDLKQLFFSINPQILPKSITSLGSTLYRLDPFVFYTAKGDGRTFILPLLSKLGVTERVSLFQAISVIRSHEWKSLKPPFSTDLNDVITDRVKIARKICKLDQHLHSFAAYSSVGLSGLYPLLVDENVSEFYIDKENSFVYLDHRDFGRCDSSVYVKAMEIEHLLTFARSASGRTMDYFNPSIRASIRTKDFHVRVSVDMPPLSIEGTSIAVRKFFINPMDIGELIRNSTLPLDAAIYCMAQIDQRRNFSVYGESGSGKTTLAVALDLLTPRTWRKISVESDVAENVSQHSYGKHQIRLLASSSTKADQEKRISVLNSLLHKSPDYVFFGEVLSAEDSTALFQMLATGLRCIHTIHADSPEALLRRFAYQHRIPMQSFTDLDVLIQMRKFYSGGTIKRRLTRISEVIKKVEPNAIPEVIDLFRWNDGIWALESLVNVRDALCISDAQYNKYANAATQPFSTFPNGIKQEIMT